jgi:hypothetical protein
MSGLPPLATELRTSLVVRFVPSRDIAAFIGLKTLAAEAFIVDETVGLFELGLQEFGQAEIVVEATFFRLNDEYDGKHRLLLGFWVAPGQAGGC